MTSSTASAWPGSTRWKRSWKRSRCSHVLGPLAGGRVAAMSTSGGDLTLLADAMIGSSLTMPPLVGGSDPASPRGGARAHGGGQPTRFPDVRLGQRGSDGRHLHSSSSPRVSMCRSVCSITPEKISAISRPGEGRRRGFVRAVHDTGTRGAVLSTFSDTISEPVAARLIEQGHRPAGGHRCRACRRPGGSRYRCCVEPAAGIDH